MADFTDRIKLVYDVVTDSATSGLSTMSSKVGEAEGAFGKLKAGGGGALDLIKNNAASAMAGAGAAIGAFVVKGIGDFTDLALAAETFATAAGTTTEEASRWLEVADDLGVSGDAVQGAMARLNREAASGKLAEFGISAGNANDRLVETLKYINSIPNATDRAAAQFALFGKSGASLAPLLANVDGLKARLVDLKGGKIIDDSDVASAKALRDSMDDLSDSWQSILLNVGRSIAPVVDALAKLVEKALELSGVGQEDKDQGFWQKLGGTLIGNKFAIGLVSDAFGLLTGSTDAAKTSTEGATVALDDNAGAATEAAAAINAFAEATLASFNSTLALADAADRTDTAIAKAVKTAGEAAAANWGNADANKAATQAMNDAEQAALAQAAAAAKSAVDIAVANGATADSVNKNAAMANSLRTVAGTLDPSSPLAQHLYGYAAQLEALPKEKTTTIKADTTDAENKINGLVDTIRSIVLKPFTVHVGAAVTNPTVAGASVAASSAPPAPATNVVALPTGYRGAPAASVSTATYNVNVSVPPLTPLAEVGRYVADALDAHEKRVGSRRRLNG